MKYFRFCRCAVNSYVGLVGGLPAFLQLSWPAMAVSVLAGTLSTRYQWLGGPVDALALAVFVVAWLRFVAYGERPAGVQFRLGRREIFTAVFWMVAESFAAFPALMLASALALATGVEAALLLVPLLVLTHVLLGGIFLIPAEIALENGAGAGWPVPDMIIQGGVAVGLGLVLAWGPSAVVEAVMRIQPPSDAADGLLPVLLGRAALVVPQYVGAALVSGYLALTWGALTAESR
jgi:hypothetical protein